jgi:anti-sigma B factor antagonist
MSFLPEPLQIISRITPQRVTMTVRGEIDLATAPQLRHAMTDRLAHGPASSLALDLSGVSFIDCAGVQALLVVQRTAQLLGGDLILTRTSPQVARLVDLLGLRFQLAATGPPQHAAASA